MFLHAFPTLKTAHEQSDSRIFHDCHSVTFQEVLRTFSNDRGPKPFQELLSKQRGGVSWSQQTSTEILFRPKGYYLCMMSLVKPLTDAHSAIVSPKVEDKITADILIFPN